jgi:hypothetical protein
MSLPIIKSQRSALVLALALSACGRLLAVSCTTQSQMSEADRSALVQVAKNLGSAIQSNNANTLKGLTVAAEFDGISGTATRTSPQLAGATLTIDALYGLDASDLKTAAEDTQFFCGVPGAPLHVDFTIPQLPPGKYALAIIHATGVKDPQQMAFLLQKNGEWQLAGLFVKPLLMAGHDSLWYWTKARAYAQKGEKWNAYFYYTIAAYLATPADFLTSTNLDKLDQETTGARPSGLPGTAQPMALDGGSKSFSVSDLHADGSLGGLDLVIRYNAADASDPVATRSRNLEVMKAMLQAHPELRDAFHGLWVYADAPNQRPFGNEVAMSEIR